MKLGIYAGSFNPFHRGHYNILQKAEKIFDKVIIARGINPEKPQSEFDLGSIKIIQDRTIMEYSGLLTDLLIEATPHYESVTLIRGLRNSVDLQYEMNQYRYFQDLMPNIQMVSIFCDKEFEHISSSGIRTLSKYGSDKVKDYLLK
jgi:pantetheine-phosphate adenylyltransferase